MTTATGTHDVVAARRTAAMRRRVGGLLGTEVRLLLRFSVVTATAVVTVLWVAILLVVPEGTRRLLVPLVLLTDVTALGFLFVPGLLVLERIEGVTAAMRVTPVRSAERVAVRVGLITALSLAAGLVVTVAGGYSRIPVALLGVAGASLLTGLIAFATVGSSATLTTFLLRAPLVAAPLLAPAIIAAIGLVSTPLLHVSPLTSAVGMMRGEMSWSGLGWQLTWILATAVLIGRTARRPLVTAAPATITRRSGAWPAHSGSYSRRAAVRSFARVDRRSLVRDGLLVMLTVSVPLVAVAGRIIGTAGVGWARDRHGIDLAPHLPAVWALLFMVHTPVIFGALTGLLLLEDRDAGVLPAVATTRSSLVTLLGYRLAAGAACTAVALAVSLPVAGVAHPAGGVGLLSVIVAAAALSSVPALLMGAFATSRVQGIAVMKIIGLPLYLPVASWFVDSGLRWLFAPSPSWWAVRSAWAATPAAAAGYAAATVAVCMLVSVVLARRVLRRAVG